MKWLKELLWFVGVRESDSVRASRAKPTELELLRLMHRYAELDYRHDGNNAQVSYIKRKLRKLMEQKGIGSIARGDVLVYLKSSMYGPFIQLDIVQRLEDAPLEPDPRYKNLMPLVDRLIELDGGREVNSVELAPIKRQIEEAMKALGKVSLVHGSHAFHFEPRYADEREYCFTVRTLADLDG